MLLFRRISPPYFCAFSFFQKELDDLQNWKQKEAEKKIRMDAKLKEEQRLIEMQLQLQRRKKMSEEQRQLEERDRITRRLQEEDNREKENERLRKEEEKRKMETLLQENKEELEIKRKKKLKEQQHELKLNADYVRMEERKEQQRQEKLKELSDKIALKMQAGSTVMQEQTNKDQNEELRTLKHQERYNKMKEDEEFHRQERLRIAKMEMKKSLLSQVEQKEEIKARERQERYEMQLKFERDYQLDQERNSIKKELSLTKARENRKILERQIKLDALAAASADQSVLEVQLNRRLLEKLDVQKVKEHMKKSDKKTVTQIAKNYGDLSELADSIRADEIGSKTRNRGQEVERCVSFANRLQNIFRFVFASYL